MLYANFDGEDPAHIAPKNAIEEDHHEEIKEN